MRKLEKLLEKRGEGIVVKFNIKWKMTETKRNVNGKETRGNVEIKRKYKRQMEIPHCRLEAL